MMNFDITAIGLFLFNLMMNILKGIAGLVLLALFAHEINKLLSKIKRKAPPTNQHER